MPDHNLNKLNYSSTRLHFQASFRAKHVCVTRVLPCTLYVCEEVCLVPEAEINMTSVAIFTQIILHTADSQFHRAGVCMFRKLLCSHYSTSLEDWKTQFLLTESTEA